MMINTYHADRSAHRNTEVYTPTSLTDYHTLIVAVARLVVMGNRLDAPTQQTLMGNLKRASPEFRKMTGDAKSLVIASPYTNTEAGVYVADVDVVQDAKTPTGSMVGQLLANLVRGRLVMCSITGLIYRYEETTLKNVGRSFFQMRSPYSEFSSVNEFTHIHRRTVQSRACYHRVYRFPEKKALHAQITVFIDNQAFTAEILKSPWTNSDYEPDASDVLFMKGSNNFFDDIVVRSSTLSEMVTRKHPSEYGVSKHHLKRSGERDVQPNDLLESEITGSVTTCFESCNTGEYAFQSFIEMDHKTDGKDIGVSSVALATWNGNFQMFRLTAMRKTSKVDKLTFHLLTSKNDLDVKNIVSRDEELYDELVAIASSLGMTSGNLKVENIGAKLSEKGLSNHHIKAYRKEHRREFGYFTHRIGTDVTRDDLMTIASPTLVTIIPEDEIPIAEKAPRFVRAMPEAQTALGFHRVTERIMSRKKSGWLTTSDKWRYKIGVKKQFTNLGLVRNSYSSHPFLAEIACRSKDVAGAGFLPFHVDRFKTFNLASREPVFGVRRTCMSVECGAYMMVDGKNLPLYANLDFIVQKLVLLSKDASPWFSKTNVESAGRKVVQYRTVCWIPPEGLPFVHIFRMTYQQKSKVFLVLTSPSLSSVSNV